MMKAQNWNQIISRKFNEKTGTQDNKKEIRIAIKAPNNHKRNNKNHNTNRPSIIVIIITPTKKFSQPTEKKSFYQTAMTK